jgi:hypothetical protein
MTCGDRHARRTALGGHERPELNDEIDPEGRTP